MGGGIRRNCGKCYSNNYDVRLERCRDCGWTPITTQSKLARYSNGKKDD